MAGTEDNGDAQRGTISPEDRAAFRKRAKDLDARLNEVSGKRAERQRGQDRQLARTAGQSDQPRHADQANARTRLERSVATTGHCAAEHSAVVLAARGETAARPEHRPRDPCLRSSSVDYAR